MILGKDILSSVSFSHRRIMRYPCADPERAHLRVAWIKTCLHNHERFTHLHSSQTFPTEIMLLIRKQIEHGYTLFSFDRAMNIRPCAALFCNRLMAERWYEASLDILSISEYEKLKQDSRPPFSVRHQPSFYCISQTDYGLSMVLLKHHPFSYRFYLQHHSYRDPMTTSVDFLPVSAVSVLTPQQAEVEKPMLLKNKIYLALKRDYRKIERWFLQHAYDKQLYPGWDSQSYLSGKHKGRCWIYPERPSSVRSGAHYDRRIKEPCIEWTQILYDLRQLQTTPSSLLNRVGA